VSGVTDIISVEVVG